MDSAVQVVRDAKKQGAKTILVNNEKELKLIQEAMRDLGVNMTVRLPQPGHCMICYEYHEDWERDCHPLNSPW